MGGKELPTAGCTSSLKHREDVRGVRLALSWLVIKHLQMNCWLTSSGRLGREGQKNREGKLSIKTGRAERVARKGVNKTGSLDQKRRLGIP